MKAAILKSFGAPLVVGNFPEPVLGSGEVIVDVVAELRDGPAGGLSGSRPGRNLTTLAAIANA